MCDPKIETVKYLELINQNKIGLIFGTASKLCKFCGHASGHSTFKTPFYEIGVQILPKITRKKKLNLPQESTEVNTCYHDVLHLTVLGNQMETKMSIKTTKGTYAIKGFFATLETCHRHI